MIDSKFKNQVDLLLEVLGPCLIDERLALKEGMAINLFYQETPRLSVDIDHSREEFIGDITDAFKALQTRLRQFFPEINRTSEGIPKQLRISNGKAQIKVEIILLITTHLSSLSS